MSLHSNNQEKVVSFYLVINGRGVWLILRVASTGGQLQRHGATPVKPYRAQVRKVGGHTFGIGGRGAHIYYVVGEGGWSKVDSPLTPPVEKGRGRKTTFVCWKSGQ